MKRKTMAAKWMVAGIGVAAALGMSVCASASDEVLNVGTMPLTMGVPVLYAQEQGFLLLWEFCSPLSWVLIRVVGYKLRRMLYLRYSLSPEGLLSLLQDGKFLFLY